MRRTIRTIRQETPSRRESDEVRQGIECSRPTKAVDVLASIRIIQLSQINPVKQEFTCRFDLFLHWDPQHVGDVGAVREKAPDAAHEHMHIHESELAWVPIMRFPNATRYSELMRYYERRPKLGLVGFRSTMDGSFKCVQNLRYFPFDVQAMSCGSALVAGSGTSRLRWHLTSLVEVIWPGQLPAFWTLGGRVLLEALARVIQADWVGARAKNEVTASVLRLAGIFTFLGRAKVAESLGFALACTRAGQRSWRCLGEASAWRKVWRVGRYRWRGQVNTRRQRGIGRHRWWGEVGGRRWRLRWAWWPVIARTRRE